MSPSMKEELSCALVEELLPGGLATFASYVKSRRD